jgi:cysteinyl-tRNA synthetase
MGCGRQQVFPHHENELAQSQAAGCRCGDQEHMVGGRDFVRFWMHNGFVNIDSEKMCATFSKAFACTSMDLRSKLEECGWHVWHWLAAA